jgi:hypothetical protein
VTVCRWVEALVDRFAAMTYRELLHALSEEHSIMETYNIQNSAIINEQALIPQFEVFVVSVLLRGETFLLKVSIKRYEAKFRMWIVSKTLWAERR